MYKSTFIAVTAASLVVLSGCDSGSDEPVQGAAQANLNTNSESSPGSVKDTGSLSVAQDFAFDTAQSIDIEFDIEAARNTSGSVSICTRYERNLSDFDIDYDSCLVRGNMVDGRFSHSMQVTNEFSSVAAVVWFHDQSLAPLFREFSTAGIVAGSNQRSARSNDSRRVIVWK